MKIGFIGPGGTGKSTLAKMCAQQFDIPLMQSPSRACFEKHGVLTEDAQREMSPTNRLQLQLDIFDAIHKQVTDNNHGIFERTHLDNFFYTLFHCHDLMLPRLFDQMKEDTKKGLQTFDMLFFFPVYDWGNVTNDRMRSVSFGARMLFQGWTQNFLYTYRCRWNVVPNASPAERLVFIKRITRL